MANQKENTPKKINILALSDDVDPRIYTQHLGSNFSDIDLLISCGDLPYYYLEYVIDVLNVPGFFVHGNHDPLVEIGEKEERKQPWGVVNLDGKVVQHQGLILAGFEGSIRYSRAVYEYTQLQMWLKVLRIIPRLLLTYLRHERFIDILVTHSPAWGVSDASDRTHRGFKAFTWLIETFKPSYHLHGHIHIHDRAQMTQLQYKQTKVVNAHVYKRLTISFEEGLDG